MNQLVQVSATLRLADTVPQYPSGLLHLEQYYLLFLKGWYTCKFKGAREQQIRMYLSGFS